MENVYYVLHHAMMDMDGSLNIDCVVYSDIEDAKRAQDLLLIEFKSRHDIYRNDLIEEEIGLFKRVAYENELMEIQSHIEVFGGFKC